MDAKTKAEILFQDNELALRGHRLSDPTRQSLLKSLRGGFLAAMIAASLPSLPAQAMPPSVSKPTMTVESQETPKADKKGAALLIGQHHYKVEATLEAIPELKKAGADIFTLEQPEDWSGALNDYLKGPRTEADQIKLTQETFLKTELNPRVLELRKSLMEKSLASLGQVQEVSLAKVTEIAYQNYNHGKANEWGGGALNLMLKMAEKAYDSGMKVQCIDFNSVDDTIAYATETELTSAERIVKRNQRMAENIARLTKKGNVISQVGANHTGTGDRTSVEEQARSLGVKCLSIDTDPTPEEGSASNSIQRADQEGTSSQDILKSFKSLISQEIKKIGTESPQKQTRGLGNRKIPTPEALGIS